MKKPKMTPNNDGYGSSFQVRIPLWPYLITPLACLVALPATWGAHHVFGRGEAAGWTGFMLALGCVALVAFTAWASRPRGTVMRWMATGNVLVGCAWTVHAVLDGPFHPVSMAAWTVGTVVMSLAVAVYRIMRQSRGDDSTTGVLRGEFGELGDAVKVLRDASLGRPKVQGAKVATAIEMQPGGTFAEVADARAQIASVLDVPASAIRTAQDPESERRGTMTVVPVDQLRTAIADPGLSAPGRSIALPVVLGVAEDGENAQVILPGDPARHRNAVGVMGVVGMSGSGKTELLLRLLAEVVSRKDAALDVADGRKGGQLPEWLLRAAKRKALDLDAAEELIDDLPARVASRAKALGERGYKQWQEGCGIPFEVVVIFEASAVIARSSTVVDLAESVRSVGICLILELQRATYDRLPTSARSNITTWICLGVQRDDDAEAALSEDTIIAGAAPWKWKSAKPGYFYLEWMGRDQELWAAPNRSYISTDQEREAMVAAALGWTDVTPPVEAAPVEAVPVGADDEVNEAVDPNDPPDDVDPAEPIEVPAGMPRIQLGDDDKMSPEDAVAYLIEHIEGLAARGVESIAPRQLSPVLMATGMSGSWAHKQLGRLCAGPDARLRRGATRGEYRILVREPV